MTRAQKRKETNDMTIAAPPTLMSARESLNAAVEVTARTAAALEQARGAVAVAEVAKQKLESEYVAAEAAYLTGELTLTPDARAESEAAISSAERDIIRARIHLEAAEIAYSRAQKLEGQANDAVIAEDYRAEHVRFNDPQSRENILLANLRDNIVELVPTIQARKELHDRLAQAYNGISADQRPVVGKPGDRRITTQAALGLGFWDVRKIPVGEVADAIQEALRILSSDGSAQASAEPGGSVTLQWTSPEHRSI